MATIAENLKSVKGLLEVPMFNEDGRVNTQFAFMADVNEHSTKNFFGGSENYWRFAFTPVTNKGNRTKADFEKLYRKIGIEEGVIFGERPSAKRILVVFNAGATAQFTTFAYSDLKEAMINSNDEEEKLLAEFFNPTESSEILTRWNQSHPRTTAEQPAQPRNNRPTIGVMRG